jgi:hypothetical protein
MISPEFCVGSFLAVCWLISLYIAYHVGRGLEYRVWMHDLRRKLKQQYDSPWLTSADR